MQWITVDHKTRLTVIEAVEDVEKSLYIVIVCVIGEVILKEHGLEASQLKASQGVQHVQVESAGATCLQSRCCMHTKQASQRWWLKRVETK